MKEPESNEMKAQREMLEQLSNAEMTEFLQKHYGRPFPQVEQIDMLRMIHHDDDYFFAGRKKTRVKPISITELVRSCDGFNEYFGTTGTDGVRVLRDEQLLTLSAFNPSFGRRMQIYVTGLHALLIEHDKMLLDQQLQMWSASDIPFTLKTFSGGKSVHVLVRFDRELTLDEWDDLTVKTLAVFPKADHQVLTDYSVLCRTPMAFRDNGREQTVLDVGGVVPVENYRAWLDGKLPGADPGRLDKLSAARRKTRKVGAARNAHRVERVKKILEELAPQKPVATDAEQIGKPLVVIDPPGTDVPLAAVDPKVFALVKEWWDEHANETRPRTFRLQGVILYALTHRFTPAAVLAAVRALPVYAEYRQDYPDRNLAEMLAEVAAYRELETEAIRIVKRCLAQDIREERCILAEIKKSHAFGYFNDDVETATAFIRRELGRHSGKNPVDRIPVKNIHARTGPVSPEIEGMCRRFEECGCDGVFPIKGRMHEVSLKLMEGVLDSRINTILALTPGSLKSTAALVVIAARASRDNRWWLVCETVKEVRRRAEILRSMGCSARPWHAYHPDFCVNPKVTGNRRAVRNLKKEFCTECDGRPDCPAWQRATAANRWDPEGDTDVLVTTHRHWVQALVSGTIPDSVKHVVVDESPALNESFELSEAKFRVLREVLAKGNAWTFTELQQLSLEMETKLRTGDCGQIDWHIPEDAFRRILGFLHGKNSPLEDLPEDQADLVYSFLAFFRGQGLRFGMKQYDRGPDKNGDRGPLVTRFIRGEVNIDCKQHTVILDGSAHTAEVSWTGFRIAKCPELARHYPNMTVDVIQRHPSQNKLGDDESFADYRDRVLRFVEAHPKGEQLIVITNKHLDRKPRIGAKVKGLLEEIRQIHPEIVEMGYGDHIGSNEGLGATGCVFCVGLMAPYSHYVLRAALADRKEIPADLLWPKDDVFGSARLSKYRFSNDAVNAAYVRSVTRDLMQGIFRGKIRDDSNSPYRVLLVVQGLSIIHWLEKEFPGARFNYPEKGLCFAAESGVPRAKLVEGDSTRDTSDRQGYSDVERVVDEMEFLHPDEVAELPAADEVVLLDEPPPVDTAEESAA